VATLTLNVCGLQSSKCFTEVVLLPIFLPVLNHSRYIWSCPDHILISPEWMDKNWSFASEKV